MTEDKTDTSLEMYAHQYEHVQCVDNEKLRKKKTLNYIHKIVKSI